MGMNDVAERLVLLEKSWQACGSPGRVLIALSGGADSVALFCMLKALADNKLFSVAAVHVNHGLRDTAKRDADFCSELCRRNNVPFFLKEVHLQSSSENEARNARYAAIADVFDRWKADVVALAHHCQDQAETLLLHLLRGSGSTGMSGMAENPCRMVNNTCLRLWRPLLSWQPAVLRDVAKACVGGWCEDETNDNDTYLRNFLRNQVFPLLETRVPDAKEALCRASDIIRSEHEYLSQITSAFLAQNACLKQPVPWIHFDAFNGLHASLKRRVMKCFLPEDADFDQINAAAGIQSDETVNLPGGKVLRKCGNYLCITSPRASQASSVGTLIAERAFGRLGNGVHTQAMPTGVLSKCRLRYRKDGDVIQPLGMKGTRKLQDYLTDRKIPQPMRDHLPLLCIGQRVVWVIGVGAGEEARCTGNGEEVLLTYSGRLPFEP